MEEINQYRTEFEALSARERHRGKFSYAFMMRWLTLLSEDYASDTSIIFSKIPKDYNHRMHEVGLRTLASRSSIPIGLREFIEDSPKKASGI